jgi:cytochrome c553
MRFAILALILLCSSEKLLASAAAGVELCKKYPESTYCDAPVNACKTCHSSPPTLNAFGEEVRVHLGGPLVSAVVASMVSIEEGDADGDGVSNIDELKQKGAPGNPDIKPAGKVALVYDESIAMKRLKALYCGESVTFELMQKLEAADDKKAMLHAELNTCLSSEYWKKEALFRLADKKIQPLGAVGFGGNVVISDFRWDYRLFAYIMSDDRDVRELLSAQYHIDESGKRVEGKQAREELPQILGQRIVIAGGQPLQADRRAGMITTQWFLTFYTMFASLPRNTASQAYREYLGVDIAKGEGLSPIPNEPRDVDNKNVKQAACAVCHSTLDPLSYAFSTYSGIETSVVEILLNASGSYNAERQPWEAQGYILGKPTKDLMDWANQARNSDLFKQNIVRLMFRQAMSRDVLPHEQADFEKMWKSMPEDKYSLNKLLHRLIETTSFGGYKK